MLATGRIARPHLGLVFMILLFACLVTASPVMARGTQPEALVGSVVEMFDVDQATVERLFSSAEAALYLPGSRRARALVVEPAPPEGIRSLPYATLATEQGVLDFTAGLERDFPGYRSSGAYLLKLPASARALPSGSPDSVAEPLAAVSSDSFESGLTNWALADNTQGTSRWGTTTCEARTGSRSADAIRGGSTSLGCSAAYPANATTQMAHTACEAISGAQKAWLDLYVHISSETGYDGLGFYYLDASGTNLWGYSFSGDWPAWFHLVFNLKQWSHLGDLTTASCPKLYIQFDADESEQTGIGARIDDLSITTGDAPFLSISAVATPSSGAAPLSVAFTPIVAGATGGASYQWTFGDAANSTATTQNASFTYTAPGDYYARVRVEDSNARAYAHTQVHVTAASACSLSCTASVPSASTAGSAVSFQATATPSNCTGSPAYSWVFGDNQTSTQQNPSHAYASAGTYPWSLTVSVGTVTCTKSGSITVSAPSGGGLPGDCNGDGTVTLGELQNAINMILGTVPWACGVSSLGDLQRVINAYLSGGTPTCSVACTATVPASGTAGNAVGFAATATPTNCTGSPTYSWVFGDSQTSTQQNPSHTYASAGTYPWSLTVTIGSVTCQKSGSITIAASTGGGTVPSVSAGQLTSIAMGAMGLLGQNGTPDFVGIVTALRTNGPDALVDMAISKYPTLVSHITNGARIDYGAGYTSAAGRLLKGAINVTWSNVVRTSNRVTANVRIEGQNYSMDGQTVPIAVMTSTLDTTQAADGSASGDATLNGTNAAGATVSSGNAHFDTKVCKNYPISGTIVDTSGGSRRTITFNNKCDGSFGYDGPSDGYYALIGFYATDQSPNTCYTPPGFIPIPLYAAIFVSEGGSLTIDPGYTSIVDPKYQYVMGGSGYIGSLAGSIRFHVNWLDYDDTTPYARVDILGTFTGVRTAIPSGADPSVRDYFVGTSNLTFTTSAPYRPCTIQITAPATFAGPCPTAHCKSN